MGETQCAEQQPQRVRKAIFVVVLDEKKKRFRLSDGSLIDYLLGADIRAARQGDSPVRVSHHGRDMGLRIPVGFIPAREFAVGDRLAFDGDDHSFLSVVHGRPYCR